LEKPRSGTPAQPQPQPPVEAAPLSQEPAPDVDEPPAEADEEAQQDGEGEDKQDFPALRAMLEQMSGDAKPGRSSEGRGGGSGWRKILNKMTGGD